MRADTATRLIDDLRRTLDEPPSSPPFRVPADRYTSAAWLAREQPLFRAPRIAMPSSTLAAGACRPFDAPGLSALVTRDATGTIHAHANACRHRATRLVDAPCAAKAIVCPYHGWTYDLAGRNIHVPHETAFAGLPRRDLLPIDATERHGLVWLGARDLASYLGPLDDDLAALDLGNHVLWRESHTPRACNWKLVIEAFLDGYHIRVLHRASIYRFFLDAASIAEPVGDHIRAVTARRALRELQPETDPRLLATPSFILFPATTIIAHPDFVSIITVSPLAPDRTDFHHMMLVPAARAAEAEHWDRSWQLIDQTVFQREDLWVCEQVQRGLADGRTDELVFGALENAVEWFHASIDART
jgi:phenylpropionate dioxygenase-like ring-hydroxylating dioxygenase large terminal subunit